MTKCDSCHKSRSNLKSAVVTGKYYPHICDSCLGGTSINSNAAGYNRRREYEDNAQNTIQPYDANGQPRSEFYRLYPDTAKKVFTANELEKVKRMI